MKELLIKKNQKETIIFLIENEKLVEYYREDKEHQNLEGNIYIGKVQNIISGLDAAFINIGEGKNAFIHKKDILSKQENALKDKNNSESITKLIKPGQPILVEVKKDKTQTKGARVSTHISLRGRFVVLMPNCSYITISSKILDTNKRESLKDIVKEYLPEGFGAIIRTNAQNVAAEEILKDIQKQILRWEKIKNIEINQIPKKIYDSGGILKKMLIDLVDYNLDKIIVDDIETKKSIEEILKEIDAQLIIEIAEKDIEELYNIKKEILKLNENRIWLKSGAFITIDYTEALTAIDVNTGKFIRKYRY